MAARGEFGVTKRGKQSFIYRNYEYWKVQCNKRGETLWRCCKYESLKCKAMLHTKNEDVLGNTAPEHTHGGNVANSQARKAIAEMKKHMTENIATPSASQGAVVEKMSDHVRMALPKRASLSRVLRRHRQVKASLQQNGQALPGIPTDMNFAIPQRFEQFLLHDSGPGDDRLLVFGDRDLLQALGRSALWLADGTFKVVPTLFYQLYTIHFDYVGGIHPAGVYCLLPDKSGRTYARLMDVLKVLVPNAQPRLILTDFESAAMNAFNAAYPSSYPAGCYFHLCQSVIRKVNEVGLKSDYETDDEIRGFVRCLPALSHVPEKDVADAFDELVQVMPLNKKINDVVTYFENTYIRGRRRPGRGNNYGPAIFPIPV